MKAKAAALSENLKKVASMIPDQEVAKQVETRETIKIASDKFLDFIKFFAKD